MVRVLALRFIYDKKSSTPSPMGEDVSLTMALVISEGHRSKGAKLKRLSKLSLPFWVVQTSQTTSLLLSSFGDRAKKIETKESAKLAEIRRILSSEISSPDAIPGAVERISSIIEETTSSVISLDHVPLKNTDHPYSKSYPYVVKQI